MPGPGCSRRVRNCPGRAGGTAPPPGSARCTETTEALSRSTAVTASGRNPGQAGGGLTEGRPTSPAWQPALTEQANMDWSDTVQPSAHALVSLERTAHRPLPAT